MYSACSSCILGRVLRLVYRVSCIVYRVLCILYRACVSHSMYHVSCIVYRVSCIVYCVFLAVKYKRMKRNTKGRCIGNCCIMYFFDTGRCLDTVRGDTDTVQYSSRLRHWYPEVPCTRYGESEIPPPGPLLPYIARWLIWFAGREIERPV